MKFGIGGFNLPPRKSGKKTEGPDEEIKVEEFTPADQALARISPGEERRLGEASPKEKAAEEAAHEEAQLSENQKRARAGEGFKADWIGTEGKSISFEDLKQLHPARVKEHLKGLIERAGAGKGIEWTKGKVEKAGGYFKDAYMKNADRIGGLFGAKKGKEALKATKEKTAERAAALSTFLKEHYAANYSEKSLAEKGKRLGVDLVASARAYNKLPFKTKMKIAGGFLALSGGAAALGLSGTWTGAAITTILVARRGFGGLASAVGTEALLQKAGMKNTIARYLIAGGVGFAVGEGAVGNAMKEAWTASGGNEWLAHMMGHVTHAAENIGTSGYGPSIPAAAAWHPDFSKGVPHVSMHNGIPDISPEDAGNGLSTPHPSLESATTGAAPMTPEGALTDADQIRIEVTRHGEGADQLWRAFQHKLEATGYAAGDPNTPPAIRHILETNPHLLSEEYGFANESTSSVIHAGDAVSVDANGNIIFAPEHGEAITLAHTAADGSVVHAGSAPAPVESGRAVSAPHPEDAERLRTAALNLEQLDHPGEVPAADAHADLAGASHVIENAPVETHPLPPVETAASAHGASTAELNRSYNPTAFHEGAAPAAEAVPAHEAAPAPAIESPSYAVNAITHSPSWEHFHNTDTWTVAFGPDVANYSAADAELRGNFFKVMRETGIGFKPHETASAYLERVNNLIAAGIRPKVVPGVYNVQGHFIARGGDLMAKQDLFMEFRLHHPGVAIVVENEGGYSTPTTVLGPDGTWINERVDLTINAGPHDYQDRVL